MLRCEKNSLPSPTPPPSLPSIDGGVGVLGGGKKAGDLGKKGGELGSCFWRPAYGVTHSDFFDFEGECEECLKK